MAVSGQIPLAADRRAPADPPSLAPSGLNASTQTPLAEDLRPFRGRRRGRGSRNGQVGGHSDQCLHGAAPRTRSRVQTHASRRGAVTHFSPQSSAATHRRPSQSTAGMSLNALERASVGRSAQKRPRAPYDRDHGPSPRERLALRTRVQRLSRESCRPRAGPSGSARDPEPRGAPTLSTRFRHSGCRGATTGR